MPMRPPPPLLSVPRAVAQCARAYAVHRTPGDDRPPQRPAGHKVAVRPERKLDPSSPSSVTTKSSEAVVQQEGSQYGKGVHGFMEFLHDKLTINEPASLNFYSPTGEKPVDFDAPMGERLRKAPGIMWTEGKKQYAEWKDAANKDVTWWHGPYHHGETHVQFDFSAPDALNRWKWGADSGVEEGRSTCDVAMSGDNTAIFSGNLDTNPPKDGRRVFAGWASLKSKMATKSWNRYTSYHDYMEHFTHMILKVRGDGRIYMLNLFTPGDFDIFYGDAYHHPIYTHGGPYWQYVKIPFSRCYFACAGRIQDVQRPLVNHHNLRSVGITLQDRHDGPFRLELAWIGFYYDSTHTERNAYEAYSMPTEARYLSLG